DFRDQYYGFTSTDGNPLERHWGRAGGLGRSSHVFGLNLFFNAFDAVRINANIRRLSGARFTPMVDRDINGDGSGGNDRAFVFDPATTSDPAVAAAMQTLLTSGSKRARECLSAQL